MRLFSGVPLELADTMSSHEPEPKQFNPKQPVQLDPPKDDPITYEELSKCDGECIPPSIIDARNRIYIY